MVVNLLNYSVFVSEMPNQDLKSLEKKPRISIDEELERLQKEYLKQKKLSLKGLNTLTQNVEFYEEPESVVTLEQKNDKEIKYLQKTIIQMELKQLAESIAMVTQKKRLRKLDRQDHFDIKNRPFLW